MEKTIDDIAIDIGVWLLTWSESEPQFFCNKETALAIRDFIERCRFKHSRRGRAGRRPEGDAALTNAQRSRRKREKKNAQIMKIGVDTEFN